MTKLSDFLTDPNSYPKNYIDSSLNNIRATYIPDVSLNDSYFKWVGGFLEPSVATGTGDVTKSYVDGSLSTLNASVNTAFTFYATNSSVNSAFLTNSSLGNLTVSVNTLNSSLNTLLGRHNVTEVSLGLITTRVSGIETSLGSYATNASVGLALRPYATNASIGLAGFLTSSSLNPYATNASVGLALGPYATNASVGLAIAPFATNASVGLALGPYATNTSIGLAKFVKEASLSVSKFAWIGGFLEPSIASGTGDVTKAYVDGSLATLNASVNTAFTAYATNASIGLAGFLTSSSLNPYATNASVGLALGAYATNASISNAAFAKNASLSLYTLVTAFNSSIGALYTNAQTDASFAFKSGFAKISVGTATPSNPTTGDLWVDTNA